MNGLTHLPRRTHGVAAPSWGASFVLHTFLLLVLAAWLVPSEPRDSLVLLSRISMAEDEPQPEVLTVLPVNKPLELAVLDEPTPPEEPTESLQGGDDSFSLDPPATSSAGQHGTSPVASGGEGGRGGGRAEFFGTVADGDRFVYVIDVSGSMNGGVRGRMGRGSRFERVCHELLGAIERLHEDQSFFVILFADKAIPMFDDHWPSREGVAVTPENRTRFRDWLASVELGGGTEPGEALKIALSMQPSAVFFLSDGEFNLPDAISVVESSSGTAQVSGGGEESRSGQVPIHAFAFESTVGRRSMQRLSMQTGGEYRFVPALSQSERRSQTTTARANMLLELAIALESRGQHEAAIGRYRGILTEFCDTIAATKARKRLHRLTHHSGQ